MQNDDVVTIDASAYTQEGAGLRYEDVYGRYLELFQAVATNPAPNLQVTNAKLEWAALLQYLNCEVRTLNDLRFLPANLSALHVDPTYRSDVEVQCGFTPETVDALWKCDRQWVLAPARTAGRVMHREFRVTCNGSFDRPEIQEYEKTLANYIPTKRKVVLVPCAADKPYPSTMHKAVLSGLPDDYYMANATGVLGIVPQDLWDVMPYYDSGIPNEWRCTNILVDYFSKHQHDHVVVYCDFYTLAVKAAFDLLAQRGTYVQVDYVLPIKFYADYTNLLDPSLLSKLGATYR